MTQTTPALVESVEFDVVRRSGDVVENQNGRYIIYAGMDSPYSYKLRSYLSYKHIAYSWILRDATILPIVQNVKPATLPYLHFPDGTILSDSTPLIYQLERLHPSVDKPVIPTSPGLAFLAHLVEDFCDELFSNVMFYYRWQYDQTTAEYCAARIARFLVGVKAEGQSDEDFHKMLADRTNYILKRQQRAMRALALDTNASVMEGLFDRVFTVMEAHLTSSLFLFSNNCYPSIADFALFGMAYPLSIDPAPAAIMTRRYPRSFQWVQRMVDSSGFSTININGLRSSMSEPRWEVTPGALALLAIIGDTFLPISFRRSTKLNKETYEVPVGTGRIWREPAVTNPYSVAAFNVLLKEYRSLPAKEKDLIHPILIQTRCLPFLISNASNL